MNRINFSFGKFAAILATALLATGCAGLSQLQQLQQGAKTAQKGQSAYDQARKQALQTLQIRESISQAQSQQAVLTAQIEAERAKIDELTKQAEAAEAPSAISTPDGKAKALEARKKVADEQEKLAALLESQLQATKTIEEQKAKLTELAASQDKYGKAFTLSPSSALASNYQAQDGSSFSLPSGKYALVGFCFNRQVLLESKQGKTEERLEPGLLNDTNEFWVGQKIAIQQMWDSIQPLLPKLFAGVESIDQATVLANPQYQKIGTFVPVKMLGITQPFDYYLAPGFGYYNPFVASKMAEAAKALGADYLVNLEWSASYAAYDGNWKSAFVQERLQLHMVVCDKNGKMIIDQTFDNLSTNNAGTADNEIYPEAIGWLSAETAPSVWNKALKAAGK